MAKTSHEMARPAPSLLSTSRKKSIAQARRHRIAVLPRIGPFLKERTGPFSTAVQSISGVALSTQQVTAPWWSIAPKRPGEDASSPLFRCVLMPNHRKKRPIGYAEPTLFLNISKYFIAIAP